MNIKLSNFWANFEDFRKRIFPLDRATYDIIKTHYNKKNIGTVEFQSMVLDLVVDIFIKHPRVFDYSEVEREAVFKMMAGKADNLKRSLDTRIAGQLFEKEMIFWGNQPRFKWKRAEAAKGIAAVGAMNTNRPYYCSATEMPGFHIRSQVDIGELRNHRGNYISDDENDWYMMFYSTVEAGNLSLTKRFDFEHIEKAKAAFENMFLQIMYTDRHPQFKERINTTEFISLSI